MFIVTVVLHHSLGINSLLFIQHILLPQCLVLPVHFCTSDDAILPSLFVLCQIDCLTPCHIHSSDVFSCSFLPVLSRSASSTLPLRAPVHGLYSQSFSLHPCHVSHPA